MYELLLKHKIEFNVYNKEGFHPIHMAVRKGQIKAIKFIIKQIYVTKSIETSINKANQLTGWTSLHLAAHFGQLRIL